MTSLIFLITFLALLILIIRLLAKLLQKRVPVPMGTEICFDDWCATITRSSVTKDQDSTIVFLTVMMSNHARGIAQSPSEPRVYINGYPYSVVRQQAYERQHGRQPGIGHRLELNQSLETVMIFAVPQNTSKLQALIEEGPWVTDFLFPEDQMVFAIK